MQSNLGVQPRFRNDRSVFSKVDYRDSKNDRFYLSLNWNRFDSPGGFIQALWQISDHVSYFRGYHTFKFGIEFTHTHLTDLAFGGFDPAAEAQKWNLPR